MSDQSNNIAFSNIIVNKYINISSSDDVGGDGNNEFNIDENNNASFVSKMQDLEEKMQNLQKVSMFENNSSLKISTVFSSLLLNCQLLCMDIGEVLVHILQYQTGNLTLTQGILYKKWYEIVFILSTYKEMNDDGVLSTMSKKLTEIMFLNNRSETVNDLIKSYSSSKESSVIQKWEFTPKTRFDDFVGRALIVQKLKSYIKYSQIGDSYQMIMMTGPPGVGKSQFAQAMMNEFQSSQNYILNMSELLSGTVGETEKALKTLFTIISENDLSIRTCIFFDEADNIFSLNVTSFIKSVAMVIQTSLQGSLKLKNNILILAATNYADELSKPMTDRINSIIYIDSPDRTDIEAFLVNEYRINSMADATASTFSTDNVIVKQLNDYYFSDVLMQLLKAFPLATSYRNINAIISESRSINLERLASLKNKRICILVYIIKDSNTKSPPTRAFIQVHSLKWNSINDILQMQDVESNLLIDNILKVQQPTFISCDPNKHINVLTDRTIFDIRNFRPDFQDFLAASKNTKFMTKEEYDSFRVKNFQEVKHTTPNDFIFMQRT